MYCPECYQEMPEDISLCQSCGCPLNSVPQKEKKIMKGRYEIISSLAEGGMGEILLAYDIHLKRPCAIKGHHREGLGKLPYEEREIIVKPFEKEAELLANLRHPNLPCVTDYFIENDTCYIVMDYIEGKDLEVMLDENNLEGLPEKQVVEWAIQICRVLEYLHNQTPPIIHGDIKPANLIIRNHDGWLMLVDFGSASFKKLSTDNHAPYGTDGYAAPEQYMGIYDIRSDIYSLGCTLYELLTAHLPEEPFNFIPLRNIVPGLSSEIEYIIMKCVQYKLEKRINNITSMKQRLLALYNKGARKVKNKYSTGMIQNEKNINMVHQLLEARKKSIKIFIIDDKMDKCNLYREMLQHLKDIRIVGVSYSKEEALEKIHEKHIDIDVILLDNELPAMGGLELIKEINRIAPSVKIIIMSEVFNEEQLRIYASNGISGYIVKREVSWEEAGNSIREAFKSEFKFSNSVEEEEKQEISFETTKYEETKNCPCCEKPNRIEAKFCNECGKNLLKPVDSEEEETEYEEIIEEIFYEEEEETGGKIIVFDEEDYDLPPSSITDEKEEKKISVTPDFSEKEEDTGPIKRKFTIKKHNNITAGKKMPQRRFKRYLDNG